MNDQHWERIVRNWDSLKVVHPNDVTDHLYKSGALDWETASKGFQTITQLLKVLKNLPDFEVFEKFMHALKNTGYESLAKEIEETAVTADPTVKARGDPTLLEPRARKVLLDRFKIKKDAEVSLLEVREELKKNHIFREITWKDEKIKHFLLEIFNGIKISRPQRKQKGDRRVKIILVKHLCHVTDAEEAEDETHPLSDGPIVCEPEILSEHRDFLQTKNVSLMSASELKQHLLPKMIEKKLPTECLDVFEEQNILGEIFLTLQEKDIKEILPDACFGVCRYLWMQVRQFSERAMVVERMEILREFDSPVTHLTGYKKGLCCDISNNVKDKAIIPIKKFFPMEQCSKESIPELIGSEVVPFASACLNQRRNGTIYFGIATTAPHKPGEIVGIFLHPSEVPMLSGDAEECVINEKGKCNPTTQRTIQTELNYFLEHSFLTCQLEIIKHAVRDAKFIPVIERDNPTSNLWVVEIDVNPSSELLKREMFPTLLKQLPIHRRRNKMKDGIFTFSSDGKLELLDAEARHNFNTDHALIIAQRERDELDANAQTHSNLRKKLLNLLTGGNELIEDMMFFFVVLSPISQSPCAGNFEPKTSLNAENLQFIKCLGPEVVFDFDPHGRERGVYSMLKMTEEIRVLTTDNFDDCKRSQEEMTEQEKSLAIESKLSWFFCNGYSPLDILPLSAVDWIKRRKICFQECLRLFTSIFGKNRTVVLICLMSKDCDILVDASGEILAKLSDNWMVLAEAEDVAKHWQSQVLHRNWVNEEDLQDRCVIGMPWDHVNTTIQQAKQPVSPNICCVPTSTGAFVEVKEKKINDWRHIEVLSATFIPKEESEEYSKKVEENFYRGEQAEWSNFYFKPQVLVRDKHENLMSLIEKALKSQGKGKRNKVALVELIHQPMAGGTTSAKQALWDLRREYRCCEVKAITDHTARELNELHKYREQKPKPVLVLIDNLDEEKVRHLLEELEDQGQKSKSFDVDEVNFVAIVCRRNTSVDRRVRHMKKVCLEQELSKNELQWFREKDQYLNKRFKEGEASGIDPKFLIAFNIMKKRFNPSYIEKTVTVFTDAVNKEREVKLLKMVSFLNLYDPLFIKISVSCLDDLLLNKKHSWGKKETMLIRNQNWDALLTPEVKVLLNLSSDTRCAEKNRRTVCTFNQVIAGRILSRILQRTNQKLSEVMFELLDSSMFVQQKHDTASLIGIVSNIVKTRLFVGTKKQKFSQFLIDVNKEEGPETAVNLLEQVYEMNNDPFTAQLISRFYMIELKDWKNAEGYAQAATSKVPKNSYLWDTYAQIYQCQLQDEISDSTKIFTRQRMKDWILLSMKSLDTFRKIEAVNDEKCEEYEPLLSCYFGELRSIEVILQGISKNMSFSSPSSFHRFLVEQDYVPEELKFLKYEEIMHFKSLQAIAEEAFTRLNDESVQMKTTIDFTLDAQDSDYNFGALGNLSSSLESYFGQNSIQLKAREKEVYNYSLAKKLGGTHLTELLKLREDESISKLNQIHCLMRENLKSETPRRFDYLLTAVGSCTLLMLEDKCPPDLNFNTLLSWCHNLIESPKKRPRGRYFLEPFLFYVMYNFPTEERKQFKICSEVELQHIIKRGTDAFQANNPNYARRRFRKRKFTTMFFLGTRGPLNDIVHQDMLTGMEGQSPEDKWLLPQLKKTLKQLRGILLEGGDKLRFSSFEIQTAYRIENTAMWQKPVYFYVGFSWTGPLAYGIKTVIT